MTRARRERRAPEHGGRIARQELFEVVVDLAVILALVAAAFGLGWWRGGGGS